ncbi:3-isopropylmalate dehydratase small subunit [Variovorax sp. RA8]|uniref:3-isopropylmalate dehydratase small subunit n=1 Tax=Variovorax sp. (strain JCM 16519 / RA8) TaxID=662548 RepID=UPI000B19DC06|nr:3-isopropylmalate dehydratase small subunit [Variovorax sp. RA8]VTU29787.1 3-isopropylmalate dehydratase small subunit [Variovorax sp. RA8]
MSALVELRGPAAAMLSPNINTDIIAPLVRAPDGKQPAGIRSDAELAQRLFGPWRYDGTGAEQPDFVLNQAPFRQARFLLAGPNFACGSSRETAATMLKAFGIRCVIAPSFGQIFQDNCFRNHMLPLVLNLETVQHLGTLAASGADFLLDVERSALVAPDGREYRFALPSFRQTMLLRGEDEVAVTLRRADQISVYQQSAKARRPWEWPGVVQ